MSQCLALNPHLSQVFVFFFIFLGTQWFCLLNRVLGNKVRTSVSLSSLSSSLFTPHWSLPLRHITDIFHWSYVMLLSIHSPSNSMLNSPSLFRHPSFCHSCPGLLPPTCYIKIIPPSPSLFFPSRLPSFPPSPLPLPPHSHPSHYINRLLRVCDFSSSCFY